MKWFDRLTIPREVEGKHKMHKRYKKWAAQITCNNKTHHLSYVDSEIAAARAYDKAARKFHGQFAALNFD